MKIVIVGGGTAGWLTTLLFRRYLPPNNYQIENVSTPEIPTIGVGESTTFRFIDCLQRIGIPLLSIYEGCDALPKLGIKFDGWAKKPGYFIGPIDGSATGLNYHDHFLYHCLENDIPIEYAGLGGYQSYNKKTNFYKNTDPSFNTDLDYTHFAACHIDTYSTGQFLKNISIKESGVIHHEDKVIDIVIDDDKIDYIILSSGEKIYADLFVDCTGFSKIISKKVPGYEWESYSKYLLLNRAMPFLVEDDDAEFLPVTTAKTMSAGWIWEIPSRNRIGRGCVFDSNFISDDEVISELETIYGKKISLLRSPIDFEAGKQKKVINKNCLSVGLSASFLEPLEATNIHCTIVQIENFIQKCIHDNKENEYNNFCNILFDNMKDFVCYHYTGGKEDSPFWRHVKNLPRPDKVNEILKISEERIFNTDDWYKHDGQAGQPLWDYIAVGLGHLDKNKCKQFTKDAGFDKEGHEKIFDNFHEWCKNISSICLTGEELNQYFKDNK